MSEIQPSLDQTREQAAARIRDRQTELAPVLNGITGITYNLVDGREVPFHRRPQQKRGLQWFRRTPTDAIHPFQQDTIIPGRRTAQDLLTDIVRGHHIPLTDNAIDIIIQPAAGINELRIGLRSPQVDTTEPMYTFMTVQTGTFQQFQELQSHLRNPQEALLTISLITATRRNHNFPSDGNPTTPSPQDQDLIRDALITTPPQIHEIPIPTEGEPLDINSVKQNDYVVNPYGEMYQMQPSRQALIDQYGNSVDPHSFPPRYWRMPYPGNHEVEPLPLEERFEYYRRKLNRVEFAEEAVNGTEGVFGSRERINGTRVDEVFNQKDIDDVPGNTYAEKIMRLLEITGGVPDSYTRNPNYILARTLNARGILQLGWYNQQQQPEMVKLVFTDRNAQREFYNLLMILNPQELTDMKHMLLAVDQTTLARATSKIITDRLGTSPSSSVNPEKSGPVVEETSV